MDGLHIKQKLHTHLRLVIEKRKEELILAIRSAKESRDNDAKSSVGDKHETTRALVQIEIDKLEIQWDKTLHLEKELSMIHPEKEHTRVETGSLVFTNYENYFISIGLGKVELDSEFYYCISLASPIGKFLHGKRKGDRILFNGREIELKQVI